MELKVELSVFEEEIAIKCSLPCHTVRIDIHGRGRRFSVSGAKIAKAPFLLPFRLPFPIPWPYLGLFIKFQAGNAQRLRECSAYTTRWPGRPIR